MDLTTARKQMIEAGKWIAQSGLVRESEGNLSIRLSETEFVMTSKGSELCHIEEKDLIHFTTTDFETVHTTGSGQISSEFFLHLKCYELRPDIHAIAHAHPGLHLISHNQEGSLADIPVVPYAPPGTPALAKHASPFIPGHSSLILERHGALTMGTTIQEAIIRMKHFLPAD